MLINSTGSGVLLFGQDAVTFHNILMLQNLKQPHFIGETCLPCFHIETLDRNSQLIGAARPTQHRPEHGAKSTFGTEFLSTMQVLAINEASNRLAGTVRLLL